MEHLVSASQRDLKSIALFDYLTDLNRNDLKYTENDVELKYMRQ